MSNQQPKNNTKGILIAVFFSVIIFIVILTMSLYGSLNNLNILTSINKSLAVSALISLIAFVVMETIAKYRRNTGTLTIAAKTMGIFGLIFASIHILSVTMLSTETFSKEQLSEQGISISFAWAAVVALTLLFFGFIKTMSEKLGEKRWIYIQALGYLSLVFIIIHALLIKKPSLSSTSSVQALILAILQRPEVTFVLAFLAIIIVARSFLYLLNKKVSLQIKIIAHTLLYLTISAVIIIAYFATAETERNYNEIFRSNKHTMDYMKSLSDDDTIEKETLYKTADTITDTSQYETIIFFLNNDRRVIHHPEKKEEDRSYVTFDDSKLEDGLSIDNIKKNENNITSLDTISRIDSENYIVISTDYSKARENSAKQLCYSSFLIVIVTFVTTTMMVLFSRTNIIKPIKKVIGAANNISKGNFDSKVEIKGNDEFKILADTFNNMSQTLQKQINDLMKLDKLKNEFIAIASHNLRTPLTTLRGYLDSLEMGQVGKLSQKQQTTLGKAQRATTSLVSLTEGLINITSLEKEGVKIEKDSVNLNQIINNILQELAPKAKEKNIKIKNNIGKGKIQTIGDAAKLKQAFMSILDNAIKFNNEGGQIIIEKIIDDTRQPTIGRKEFIVTIKDTGIGISKEKKENVFQKFNRGTSTYTYEYEGVGLGLYIARLIIQAHHGRIWFESKEGKGTTFYISLTVE